jgi:hypothetical protein
MQGNEKTIGDVIGEALRPRTVLDALRESRREIREEIDEESARLAELQAREHDMTAEISALQGYPLDAEYSRARAAQLRKPCPETAERRHRAYVRMQAASFVRLGTVPVENDPDREEILAAMDEVRQ